MHEIVIEGRAAIKIRKTGKVSREMGVFYNPAMKLNRDISILLLNSTDKNKLSIADPLAGSGIRSIRFILELNKPKIGIIAINDYSKDAFTSIKNNLKLNKINDFTIIKKPINLKLNGNNKRIMIFNEDANLFLLNSSGFDYIDIDPFGSSNSYLDAAIKRISRNGILAVTNTDTAALTGTYPNACIRKYWAKAKRDCTMHETGLRILIRRIQMIGMQYEKALFPIFSYFKEHYFRVFFQCIKGKKLCDEIAGHHGIFNDCGPLWLGKLWDSKLADKMYGALLKNSSEKIGALDKLGIGRNNKKYYNNKNLIENKIIIGSNNQNYKELLKLLMTIKDESKINAVGFYNLHDIAGKMKLKIIMRKERLIKEIKKSGFKAAETHFSGTGVRSGIKLKELVRIMGQA